MIDATFAREFAADWIDAWNAHDLERILAHYTDDFEMRSPLIVERMGVASGVLRGKAAIREYWGKSLASTPQLHFELHDVLVGVDSIVLYYHSRTAGQMRAEALTFNAERKVAAGAAAHGKRVTRLQPGE